MRIDGDGQGVVANDLAVAALHQPSRNRNPFLLAIPGVLVASELVAVDGVMAQPLDTRQVLRDRVEPEFVARAVRFRVAHTLLASPSDNALPEPPHSLGAVSSLKNLQR